MNRSQDIEALFQSAEEILATLNEKYKEVDKVDDISPEIKVKTYLFLNSLRPILDYIATEIGGLVGNHSSHTPYFPYRHSKKKFLLDMKRDFPNLEISHPLIFNFLIEKQPFSGDSFGWLGQFISITNKNKHDSLSYQNVEHGSKMIIGNGALTVLGGFIKVSRGATINGKFVEEDFKIDGTKGPVLEENEYFGSIVRSTYSKILFNSIDDTVPVFLKNVHDNLKIIYSQFTAIFPE